MFWALKTDCYFRKYGEVGYIARPIIGLDEVVDENGAIFINQLQYEPKSIDEIVNGLLEIFSDVDSSELETDAVFFYEKLQEDGFLNCSETLNEFKSDGFDYSTLKGRMAYKDIHSQNEQATEIFLSEYSKEQPFLQNFHIELTSRCNERCIHCYIPNAEKTTDIEYHLMMDVLDQCKDMGVMSLVFSGGEPMLHPNFCDFLKRAKDLDFNVTVLSNLTLLNDDIIEALKYRHGACVNVSLYSMEADVHDAITTYKGSFEKTKNNILRLISNNIAVQINCPVMKQNKDSFQGVITWGQEHKCAVITDYAIMGRSDRTTDNLNNRLTKEDFKEVIEKIAENNVFFRLNLKSEGVFAEYNVADADKRVCGVGLSTLCMVSNGNVYPCAGWQQYVCGNLNDTPLCEIWDNSSELKYLRNLRLRDFEECVGCEDYCYCLMCVSRNYNESREGSIFDIPPITCESAHIYHEVVEEFKKKSVV